MKSKTLQKLLEKWQKILRLQDWVITVKFVGKEDIDTDTFGQSAVCDELKIVKIRILKPEDIVEVEDKDIEQTLIHELLHAHFEVIYTNTENSETRHILYERAIEQVSRALVGLSRK